MGNLLHPTEIASLISGRSAQEQAAMKKLLDDIALRAVSGQQPPIRHNVTSRLKRLQDSARPDWAKKQLRVAGKKLTRNVVHSKRTIAKTATSFAIGTAAGTATGLAVGAAFSPVTFGGSLVAGVAIGAGVGAAGTASVFITKKGITKVKVHFKKKRAKNLTGDQKKKLRSLAYILANGDLFKVACSVQEVLKAVELYKQQKERWDHTNPKTCDQLVLVLWRHLRVLRRGQERLADASPCKRAIDFGTLGRDALTDAEDVLRKVAEVSANTWIVKANAKAGQSQAPSAPTATVKNLSAYSASTATVTSPLDWGQMLDNAAAAANASPKVKAAAFELADAELAEITKKAPFATRALNKAKSMFSWVATKVKEEGLDIGQGILESAAEEAATVGLTAAIEAPCAPASVAGAATGLGTSYVYEKLFDFIAERVNDKLNLTTLAAAEKNNDYKTIAWILRSMSERANLEDVAKETNQLLDAIEKVKLQPNTHFTAQNTWVNDTVRVEKQKGAYELLYMYLKLSRHIVYICKMSTFLNKLKTDILQDAKNEWTTLIQEIHNHWATHGANCNGTCYCDSNPKEHVYL